MADAWTKSKLDFSWEDMSHIVIDHVSIAWTNRNGLGVWSDYNYDEPPTGLIQQLTLSNSITYQALMVHSCGWLLCGKKLMMTKNLSSCNNNRNPYIKIDTDCAVWNNVMHNIRYRVAQLSGDYDYYGNGPSYIDFRGNVVTHGPQSFGSQYGMVRINGDMDNNHAKIYMHDNIKYGTHYPDYDVDNGAGIQYATDEPIEIPNALPFSSSDTYDAVINSAGAWPAFRDYVDQQAVSEVENGNGEYIDAAPDLDTSKYSEVADAFVPVSNPHGMYDSQYTRLEKQLHACAYYVEHGSWPSWGFDRKGNAL